MHNHRHWVGTWTTAPAPAEGVALSNHTARMNVRASIGGDTLRVRLSNAYGTRKLLVGAARVGLRDTGPAIVKGSDRMLTFGGAESATIAAGSLLISDPVSLPLPPLGDLAISVYLPGDLPATFGITGRYSRQTNYISPPGNFASAVAMLGTNDLRNRWAKPDEEVTAEQMIAGLKQLAVRAQTRGIKIFGGTLTPFENETFLPGAWTPERESKRQAVNAWIRDGGAFDAVVDFDEALRDPDHPTRMLPIYDCGDHLHPSDLGYNTMGDAVDLSRFDKP